MSTLLFVYGSLKSGFERHAVLRNQRFVCCAATIAKCRLFDCGSYPALLESSDGISVRGELYEVDQECLHECDAIEGVEQGLYARRVIGVASITDALYSSDAWAYFYLQSTVHLSDCGCEWIG